MTGLVLSWTAHKKLLKVAVLLELSTLKIETRGSKKKTVQSLHHPEMTHEGWLLITCERWKKLLTLYSVSSSTLGVECWLLQNVHEVSVVNDTRGFPVTFCQLNLKHSVRSYVGEEASFKLSMPQDHLQNRTESSLSDGSSPMTPDRMLQTELAKCHRKAVSVLHNIYFFKLTLGETLSDISSIVGGDPSASASGLSQVLCRESSAS